MRDLGTSALSGENLQFIEQLHARYLEDPESVDPSWLPLFAEYFGTDDAANGPSFRPRSLFEPLAVPGANGSGTLAQNGDAEFAETPDSTTTIRTPGRDTKFAARVKAMVSAFRLHGHLIADIDPLRQRDRRESTPPELLPQSYGFTDEDMSALVVCEAIFDDEVVTLSRVMSRLDEIYCGHIAVEYQNIPNTAERHWLRKQIERNDYAELDDVERVSILEKLVAADGFETFLHTKYVGAKRFSVSAGESLIPLMDMLLQEGSVLGVEEVLIGMAHRGRLNVLHNIMGKSAEAMLSEFEKNPDPESMLGGGDVKYHLGASSDYLTNSGQSVHLSMSFNPSHLEFVNPVVTGGSKARQMRRGGGTKELFPLLLHGDAAFAGQGIVAETLSLSRLPGYDVGGTIHVVTNNQIGFTALPHESRSTMYATDIAKLLEAPIFHVNADDPEACARVARLAIRFRQEFGKDVIIDHVSYRQYGHNEGDEPRFTQPLMYKLVDGKRPVREMYADQLVERGLLTREDVDGFWTHRMENYARVFEEVRVTPKREALVPLEGAWGNYRGGLVDWDNPVDTTLPAEHLVDLGTRISTIPESVDAHRTMRRLFNGRLRMIRGETPVDWAMGEALALATLAEEGTPIRISGQDSVRGTFSHRHAGLYDQTTGECYWPISELGESVRFEAYNSMLSEAGVLGFEYGYSLSYPEALVIWEAQFGDFANGAQVIIDQFINSAEDKWERQSGLVMLLPHGYAGQGPEHSSARLERFLQLSAEDNMFVCNVTTPAQYYHLLRRQVLDPIRKPLVLMSPKSLLRHRSCVSTLQELAEGAFQTVIAETRDDVDPAKVKRALLCSGKIYYDLVRFARKNEVEDVAILRLEQLYPLDRGELKRAVSGFDNLGEIYWVQEEPKNMGAWSYIFEPLLELFGSDPLPRFVGREASASPATGSKESHELEQNMLVVEAFAGRV